MVLIHLRRNDSFLYNEKKHYLTKNGFFCLKITEKESNTRFLGVGIDPALLKMNGRRTLFAIIPF